MLLEKSREIATEGMKSLNQTRNDAHLWMCLVVKVQCYKEQYCMGTWNVSFMNQSKLKVVKQEIARVNIDNLGINELKWSRMGEFNSDDHYIYYCEQESLRINGVALLVNKRSKNAVYWYNLKHERMMLVSKANHSISQQSKSMPQPLRPKKLKLNCSMKTYKVF